MPSANHTMFRRIVRRLLFANRGRLFFILLALSAGAAVSAALLNLQFDAKRRLTAEFRSFGANILVTPKFGTEATTLPDTDYTKIPDIPIEKGGKSALLFSVGSVRSFTMAHSQPVVIVGLREMGNTADRLLPFQQVANRPADEPYCFVGDKVARMTETHAGDKLQLQAEDSELRCSISAVEMQGGENDSNVVVSLEAAQHLTRQQGRISLIRLSYPGRPQEIESYAAELRAKLPDVDVRPLRQFTEAQSKIYSRISGLLTAATTIILVLTALCVMAAMTNIAAERKQDVGMMKAVGGSARGILNLFLAEAVLLGLIGGLIGAAAGIALSMALGKAVFGVAALPRLIVYPISVTLTIIVAVLGAYPLRRLANVRPATIFRGEA